MCLAAISIFRCIVLAYCVESQATSLALHEALPKLVDAAAAQRRSDDITVPEFEGL